jgi:hypothetical protein
MGLQWASTTILLMEHGTIKEGKLFQIASEKCATPSNHSSMASSRDVSLGLWHIKEELCKGFSKVSK